MYKSLYEFQVMNAVMDGEDVYYCDKEKCFVYCINDMSVERFAELIKNAKENDERYDFWIKTNEERDHA